MNLHIKRVYAEPEREDGKRILVDRLWPRGLTKEKAKVDLWLKDVSPSNELRQWFGHDPKKWPEFRRRYKKELRPLDSSLAALREEARQRTITLVYGAKDQAHNEAVVLLELLQQPDDPTLPSRFIDLTPLSRIEPAVAIELIFYGKQKSMSHRNCSCTISGRCRTSFGGVVTDVACSE